MSALKDQISPAGLSNSGRRMSIYGHISALYYATSFSLEVWMRMRDSFPRQSAPLDIWIRKSGG
jgi:hypothetical protein